MNLTRGALALRVWLDDNGHNQWWLADELSKARGAKVFQSSVSAWLRGSQIPLWAALEIQKITSIEASWWVAAADQTGPQQVVTAGEATDLTRTG